MRKKLTSERGTSAVEFALVLPLLLLVLFGIIEFSLVMYNKAMITNASREGARRGIVYRVDVSKDPAQYAPLTDDQIKADVINYLGNHLITLSGTSTPAITITRAMETSGDTLSVKVDYDYNFLVVNGISSIVASGSSSLPGSITLSSATKMRME